MSRVGERSSGHRCPEFISATQKIMLLLANSLSSKHDKEKYEPVFFQQSDDLKKSATFIYSQPTDVKQQQTAAEKEASVHISAVNRLNNS